MVRMCALALLMAAAVRPQPPAAESPARREFHTSLHLVIRAARERFRPLQGARIDIRPGRETWFEARHFLPGAASCRVYEHPLTYICRWERTAERRDLPSFFRSLAEDVAAALGADWSRSDEPERVTFERKEDATIRITGPAAGTEVALTVTPGPPRRTSP